MTTPLDKSWMNLTDRLRSPAYAEGVNTFLTLARNHSWGIEQIRCPCRECHNMFFLPIFEVESHLFIKGINLNYTHWIFHGEEETRSFNDDDNDSVADYADEYIDDMYHMLDDIRSCTFIDVPQDHGNPLPTGGSIPDPPPSSSFDQLLEDARRLLFSSRTNFSKLSFIVKLLHIKTLSGWSIKSFDKLLNLLRSTFLDAGLPQSYEESRWVPNTHKAHLIPQKVLRHFPLKPRLQCLFMSAKIAGNDIDVYLQLLLDELLEFWEHGVPTYDVSTKETFMLHAVLMWTINDFPAYGNLFG
ncbi:hypothetical protein F2P56_004089 [Juglans regia]|uniref:Transposase-associated domain-containing protein n=1 Tax=Juglans regia TaxID=51240 RepID=A0A833Y3W5_JUGRE|nr:hypothetical protein F2P56_004089 [Juglans regia]